jgi:hypothetical protein
MLTIKIQTDIPAFQKKMNTKKIQNDIEYLYPTKINTLTQKIQNDIECLYSTKINKLEKNYNKKKMLLDKKHMDNSKEVVLIQNVCRCKDSNFRRSQSCHNCGKTTELLKQTHPGDWGCPNCTYNNFSRNRSCRGCEKTNGFN